MKLLQVCWQSFKELMAFRRALPGIVMRIKG
jgi:hypothetical protein